LVVASSIDTANTFIASPDFSKGSIMTIDFHCHAGTGDGLKGPWDTVARLGDYRQRADAAGITRTVLLPVFQSDYRRGNREVAEIVRQNPQRYSGFAMVHTERDKHRIDEMVSEAVSLGLCGLKIHRHDAAIHRAACEAARRHRLPVLYDPAGEVSSLSLLGDEFPDVPFVIAHLGSFADDWGAQRHVIDLIARYPNLFADTSGVRRFDILLEAVRRAGSHKLIFGSDGPWTHPGLELAKIDALRLSARARFNMTRGNAEMLLGLRTRMSDIGRDYDVGTYSHRRSAARRDWRVRVVTPKRAAASFWVRH
jgi:predicted TIM-barrel fold metal-dependent hydrolase